MFGCSCVSELRIACTCAAGTHPIGHTVRRQWVIIPTDIAQASSSTDKSISCVRAQATIASIAWGDIAFVDTELTSEPLASGDFLWKAERPSSLSVGFLNIRQTFLEITSNAI